MIDMKDLKVISDTADKTSEWMIMLKLILRGSSKSNIMRILQPEKISAHQVCGLRPLDVAPPPLHGHQRARAGPPLDLTTDRRTRAGTVTSHHTPAESMIILSSSHLNLLKRLMRCPSNEANLSQ